ncbi:Gp19 [Enterococcus sp. C1]|uniref:DUF4041 domain-containing protein n=1 Tax=Enterococcus sp. C1 TaxID=1182762 RepID=UPI000271FF22|nr:DUF4041 domain-containing protein [Enterococcus sp. C1]EJF50925.1 Gp19 [Enterococcus sp. C1]
MGAFDFLKGNKYKQQANKLAEDLEALKNAKLSVEQMSALDLQQAIIEKEKEQKEIEQIILALKEKEGQLQTKIKSMSSEIENLEHQLVVTSDDIRFEEFGLYRPQYDFATALGYKEKLADIRADQKHMIKKKTAVNYSDKWTVDGNKAKGRKMTNDNIKQILRSFNNECEAAINKVKFSNLASIEKRIRNSYEQLNKLNSTNLVSIRKEYLQSKLDELHCAYEYERKKQEEKEELREQREREKEEKALQKEIESQKKVIDKDINHFKKMISDLHDKLKSSDNEEQRLEIQNQILGFETSILDKESEKEELDYRNAHASAGYVYIISNIGAFGADVVKIGVTRRLDPLERIAELSSASVPFKFDVHALIFSYEAYQLEADLHKYFDKQRINRVNNRKEFFKIPIEDIEKKLVEYKDLTIDFQKEPEAEEFRESLALSK